MLEKKELHLKFSTKRDYKIISPCCNRSNKDGKFVNYLDLPENYGYCHSCGKSTLPTTIYIDENGIEYSWNETENQFETLAIITRNILASTSAKQIASTVIAQKFIDESIIWEHFHAQPENNLLQYLRQTYGDEKVNDAKEVYALSTSKDGGTMFWNINKNLQVQKLKIAYYNSIGKRTNKFKVPYKNEDGYYACLFGEHLLSYNYYLNSTIVLTESEKTAIIGYILMPKYVWLAYGGINGLTEGKLKSLIDQNVLIIPDMSENAVNIITTKIPFLKELGINAKVWDMTEGQTDEELKALGIYNNDLEDVFRKIDIFEQ
ncbi:DUF6371 domain-containing protein [Flavobacterium sp. SUN052]|uniref:DUF6371 domain-containing protein n=1 Tax=Flavobacterium sp. SUN052 TaxID=3002441 RepID=UPI00237E6DC0|nr:DUF6371 domain-containing protein [Flavobacterium sp. SUN052]MEC4005879.1 DUF6371 domain-containing protein [Flavobacterium sp. SUN052]